MKRNHFIIAPHPDDELIGCFSLLSSMQVRAVCYLSGRSDSQRYEEAINCGQHFGFAVQFDTPFFHPSDILVLPSITDSHPEHKLANQKFRTISHAKKFYSVDLQESNTKTVLSVQDQYAKRLALDTMYPSQANLWATNASYYLFESIQNFDYARNKTHDVKVGGKRAVLIVDMDTLICDNEFQTAEDAADYAIHQGARKFKLNLGNGEVYENWN